MKCGKCEYDLSGLESVPRCPECGSTDIFADRKEWRWLHWLAIASGSVPVLVLISLHTMLIVARLQLGRWPHRGGMDDPKFIPVVWEFHTLTSVLVFFGMPIALCAGIFVVVAAFASCADSPTPTFPRLRTALLLVLVWIASLILILSDPARVVVWFMD